MNLAACCHRAKKSFTMADESKLLQQAGKVKSLLCGWIPKREATVHTLRVLADKLLTVHNKSCKLQVAGSSASIAGFGVTAVGFGLSFFTAGASLIVSAVGAGLGAGGGLVNAASSLAELCVQKEAFDTAQKIIDQDREAAEAVEKVWEKFGKEVQTCIRMNAVKVVWGTASTLKASYKLGAAVAKTAASEGGEALFCSLSKFDKFLQVGGFAVGAVMLPLDINSLVTNLEKIDAGQKGKKDKEPKAVKKLRELADKLEEDMHDKKEVIREVDYLISMIKDKKSFYFQIIISILVVIFIVYFTPFFYSCLLQ